ncbi:hypothetical protein T265_05329 [Opisthorchis viverrini]|uniref:Uncharacterized protein n=1 Tax=Opisthorchis viverrini TaxID=6198 RepID=A0A074ZPI1_OPIVI|nr:hypothetical protein T265_05329 [Opisthorchis viverrini]KER27702.1 hypothetical protein T265_05329 [Opisthorchis viverrini]
MSGESRELTAVLVPTQRNSELALCDYGEGKRDTERKKGQRVDNEKASNDKPVGQASNQDFRQHDRSTTKQLWDKSTFFMKSNLTKGLDNLARIGLKRFAALIRALRCLRFIRKLNRKATHVSPKKFD